MIVAEGEHFHMGHGNMENGVRLALGGVSGREELARALGIIREILES